MGKPVYTHEIKDLDTKALSEDDFLHLCGETEAEAEARKAKKALLDKYTPPIHQLVVLEQSMKEYSNAACADFMSTPYYMRKRDECLKEYRQIEAELSADGYSVSCHECNGKTKYGYNFDMQLRHGSTRINQTLSGYLRKQPPKVTIEE